MESSSWTRCTATSASDLDGRGSGPAGAGVSRRDRRHRRRDHADGRRCSTEERWAHRTPRSPWSRSCSSRWARDRASTRSPAGRRSWSRTSRDPEEVRWHEFSGPALAAGVEAIFGFPLVVGGVRLGALDLYVDHPWVLTDEQYADAVAMADVVANAILALQSRAEPGCTRRRTRDRCAAPIGRAPGVGHGRVQLDIPVADALARLRAHAYSEDTSIDDVARAVVNRELRLE